MVNVLILTEGGAKIGYGHISRSLALAQAFNEIKPEIEVKSIIRADKRAREFLKSNDANFASLDWLKRPDRIQGLIDEETVVLIDSYKAPQVFYKRLYTSKYRPYVVAMDDYNRICYETDAIINVSVASERDIGYQKRRNVRYLAGTEYIILRKEFHRSQRKKINKKIKDILITFGGAGSYKLITKTVNLLVGRGLNLHIVSPDKKVHNFAKSRGYNFYSDLNAVEMCSLMSKVDLCISGGGQTISELAYLGVPTIGICSAANQSKNIARWQKIGFLEYAGESREKEIFKKLEKSLDLMRDYDTRRKKAEIGRKAVDGKGSLRIVKTLLLDFYRKRLALRKACFKDALDIYELSNDPLIRKFSADPRKIKWLHHMSWLKDQLENRDHVFYIATNSKNFCGQVRFDINPTMKDAVISISLHKDVRGLGLASLIINRSVKALYKMRKDVDAVRAFIREKNISSINSFKKANFQFSTNLKVDGNKSKLFIRRRGEQC